MIYQPRAYNGGHVSPFETLALAIGGAVRARGEIQPLGAAPCCDHAQSIAHAHAALDALKVPRYDRTGIEWVLAARIAQMKAHYRRGPVRKASPMGQGS